MLRIHGRVEREDGTEPYMAVFDEVAVHMHIARTRPGAILAVFVDPQKLMDMAIDWIRTSQRGPRTPQKVPGSVVSQTI